MYSLDIDFNGKMEKCLPPVFQDEFFLGKCFEAMEVDSLSSSHPVSTPVENPTQIQEMFDDVSYDKVGQVFGIDAVQDWIISAPEEE